MHTPFGPEVGFGFLLDIVLNSGFLLEIQIFFLLLFKSILLSLFSSARLQPRLDCGVDPCTQRPTAVSIRSWLIGESRAFQPFVWSGVHGSLPGTGSWNSWNAPDLLR